MRSQTHPSTHKASVDCAELTPPTCKLTNFVSLNVTPVLLDKDASIDASHQPPLQARSQHGMEPPVRARRRQNRRVVPDDEGDSARDDDRISFLPLDILISILSSAVRVDCSVATLTEEAEEAREEQAFSWLWFASLRLVSQRFLQVQLQLEGADELNLVEQTWRYDPGMSDPYTRAEQMLLGIGGDHANRRRSPRFLASQRARHYRRGLVGECVVPQFLNAMAHMPWLGARVELVRLPDALFWADSELESAIMRATRDLLTSKTALPQLAHVELCCTSAIERPSCYLFDAVALDGLCSSHTSLSYLALHGCFTEDAATCKPAQFGRALSKLIGLKELALGAVHWLTDAHILHWLCARHPHSSPFLCLTLAFCDTDHDQGNAFERHILHRPQPLAPIEFHANPHRVTDHTLTVVAELAPHLSELQLIAMSAITTAGLTRVLHTCSLELLDVSLCSGLDASCLAVIGKHAPQLLIFRAAICHWFSDDALATLVHESIQAAGGAEQVHLSTICIDMTPITPAGLGAALHAVPKLGVGDEIRGCIELHNMFPSTHPYEDPSWRPDGYDEWCALRDEFPKVRFVRPPGQPWTVGALAPQSSAQKVPARRASCKRAGIQFAPARQFFTTGDSGRVVTTTQEYHSGGSNDYTAERLTRLPPTQNSRTCRYGKYKMCAGFGHGLPAGVGGAFISG